MAIFHFLIFPGFLFFSIIGGLGWWAERKLTAKFQYRVGPPWYQNFFDIIKLFCKETLIPDNAQRFIFIISPVMSCSASVLLGVILGYNIFFGQGFLGDVFVLLYLLVIPSLCIIFGGFASGNPLALAGAARETKLMLSYEFVFITALIIAILKSGGAISLDRIIGFQQAKGSIIGSISGTIGFILSIIYIQAKLGVCPFDIAEAEQEIMAGPFIEYSGPLYGFFKLSKAILYFAVPLFVISLFWMGSPVWHLVYKYLVMVLLISVIKNTNPRLRINDSLKLFWLFLFPLGIIGVILALLGL